MKLNEFKQKYGKNPDFNNILDFLIKNGYENKEIMFNFEQAKIKEQEWIKSLNKNKNKTLDGSTKTIKKFANGFKIVQLIDQQARDYEGSNMNHCVASYTDSETLYSLRDKENKPHCTIEVSDNSVSQIKGFGNGKISPKYISYILDFLKTLNFDVNHYDMANLGYRLLTEDLKHSIQKHLSNYKILKVNNTNYIYTGNKLRLIKRIKHYDLSLFCYLCSYDQCRDCFEQLLNQITSNFTYDFCLARFIEDSALSGNIFSLNLLYEQYEKSINEIDLFEIIRDCVSENQPKSVMFLLQKIKIKKNIDYRILLSDAIEYALNRDMLQALTVQMNKLQTKQFYQKALNLTPNQNDPSINLMNWLITMGAKFNKKLPRDIMYNNYKKI
jgi:hypothetical protein